MLPARFALAGGNCCPSGKLETYRHAAKTFKGLLMRYASKFIRWSVPLLVLTAVGVAAEPAEQDKVDKVQVADQGGAITLSNGSITATLNKKSGELSSLKAFGKGELLGNGGRGYYDMTAAGSKWYLGGAACTVVRAEDDMAEVAFIKQSAGFTLELHYVLRKGEPGLHVFAVHRYAKGTNGPVPGESRYVLRVDPKRFTYAYSSEKKHGPLVLPAALKMARLIMDATYQLIEGLVYTKYDWAEFLFGHWGHGVVGEGLGIWILHGSMEYFMGGPTRQELILHATDTTPVLLEMYTGGHFLGNNTSEFPKDGGWAKLYGPTFLYVNEGKDGAALLQDAKAQAKRLEEAWPYLWMKSDLYPLERGKARGKITLPNGVPAADAVVFLTAPCKDWQIQFKDYLFTTRADKEGRFTIDKVRPGTYTLYAYAPGILGEYRKDGIEVKALADVDLGAIDWVPPSRGKTLWQIGTPDRTAAEFRHGDEPRAYGLWDHYTKDFPNGVNFVIGKSKEGTDWNFAQFSGSTWNVHFELAEKRKGKATLTVAIAGAHGNASLNVLVNGTKVDTLRYANDSGVSRSANQAARYHLNYVEFDADLLRAGPNTIALQMGGPVFKSGGVNTRPSASIMYDCVRLEVGP
jgi:rhamnogalacturonan endolyase